MSKLTSSKQPAKQLTPEVNMENEQPKQAQKDASSELDINLIILSFQEKIGQLMTELVVKDATIKQLTSIINKMRG